MERAKVNVSGLWFVDWTRDADLVWTWRRTTLTRACNHGEWRAALSPGWSSCATRRKSVKTMDVCLYTVLYFARVSLLPYPWTRWTLRSSTTSTHEPSRLDSSNRGKQVGRGGRDCKITISLACQINIAKLSSCIHFFFAFCIPYLNGKLLSPIESRVCRRLCGIADALIFPFIHTIVRSILIETVKNNI